MRTHFAACGLVALGLSVLSYPAAAQPESGPNQPVSVSAQAEAQRLSAAARGEADDGPLEVEPHLLIAQATGEVPPPPVERRSVISFNNAELPIILKYIHEKTGKAVVKGPGLDEKKIHLLNTQELTDEENLKLLYRVLASQGIVVVESEDFIEVLTQADARKTNMRVVETVPPDTEREQPVVFSRELKHIRNRDILDRLKPLVRDPDSLIYDEASRSLLYTDTRSYVEKLARLLELIDREPERDVKTSYRRVENASAVELVEPCKDFLTLFASLSRAQSSQTVVRAEPQTNTLIFKGPSDEVDAVSEVVRRLDTASWNDLPRTVQRRPYYGKDLVTTVAEAKKYLASHVAIHGERGDIPTTTFYFDPLTKELLLKGPQPELEALTRILDRIDPPLTERGRKFSDRDFSEEKIQRALQLLIQERKEAGWGDFQPQISWNADPLDPTQLIFRGPGADLERFFAILDKVDKPLEKRTRRFYNQLMSEVFPEAIDRMVKQFEEEGWPEYQHSVRWKVDDQNPAQAVIEAPAEEMARLLPILDLLDKPTASRTREFYQRPAEDVVPVAIDLLIDEMAEQGTPGYQPSIRWERDTFNPKVVRFFAPTAELDLLFPFLDELDPPLSVQRYTVTNATPELLVDPSLERLKQYFADNNRPDYQPITTIRVDKPNRTLILRGPSEETTPLLSILAELDRMQWQHQEKTTQTFYLGYAKAEDLIAAASAYLAARIAFEGKPGDRPGVTYKVSPETKTIVLHGPATQLAIAAEVMNEIEKDTQLDSRPILVYPKFTSASQLYTELSQALSGIFTGAGAPVVRLNDRLGVLVLTAREGDMPVVREWIDRLDAPAQQNFTRELVRLENADPTTLAGLLTQLVTTGGRIIPDPRSGSLLIVDSTESIQRMKPFIQQLDRLEDMEKMISRVIKLKTANASYLYTALNSYASQLASSRGRSTRNQTIISYEPYSGTILLFGPEEDVTQIEAIVKDLDKVELAGREPEFIYLKNAQASQVSSALQSILSSISPSQTPPIVVPESRINAIIVAAREEVMPKVKDLIEKLDVSDSEGLELKIVKLKAAGAYYIYSTLSQFKSPRGILYYDPNTNTVIIRDIPSTLELFDKMIADLEKIGGLEGDIITRVRTMENAYAGYVYSGISTFLSVRASATGHTSRAGLYPEYNTNSILIFGPTDEIEVIDDLIDKLDSPELTAQELHVIPLKHQPASSVVSIVSNFLYSGKTGVKAPFVTYQESTNSLLVQAHAKDIEKVNELIGKLDVAADERFEFKILPVTGVSAQTVVSNMRHLLGPNVIFFAETYTNNVVINALPEEIAKVEKVIENLSQDPRKITMTMKEVQFGNASSIYSALSQLQSMQRQQQGLSYSPVGLYYEPSTNAILIFGPTDEIQTYVDLVAQMDNKDLMGQEVRVFPLKHAQASQVYNAVYNLVYSGYSGQNRPYVTYETTTNTLLVRGIPAVFTQVEDLLKQLDVPRDADFEFKVLPVKGTNAASVVSNMRHLLGPNVIFFAEPTSNTITISALPEEIRKVEQVLESIARDSREIAITSKQVKYGNAAAIYSALYQIESMKSRQEGLSYPSVGLYYESYTNSILIFGPTEEIKTYTDLVDQMDNKDLMGQEVRVFPLKHVQSAQVYSAVYNLIYYGYSGQNRPYVTYETSTNSLIVRGTAEVFGQIEEILKTLDVPGAADLEVKTFHLQWANAQTLTTAITPLISKKGTLQADPYSNSLILVDSPDMIERISEIVHKLDVEGAAEGIVTEIRPLKYADAQSIVNSIINQIALQYSRRRGGRGQAGTQAYAEPSSNTIVVVGASEEVKVFVNLIDHFDTPETAGGEVRFYQLQHTQADQLANQISRLFRQRGRRASGAIETEIVADSFTNTLMAVGSDADMKRLDALVAKLDVKGASGRQVRVIPLEGANAQQLASSLRSLSGPNGALSADITTNSLIVDDIPSVIEKIEEVVNELHVRGGAIAADVRKLKYADPSTIVPSLQQFITLRTNQQGIGQPRLSISAEVSTNSLLIFGPTSEIQILHKLIDELDTEDLAKFIPRIFVLRHIQATQIAPQIQQILAQTAVGPIRPIVVAEPTTNALIVQAPEADLERVQKLLQDLDQPESGGLEIEVIPLKNSSALELSRTLQRPPLSNRGTAFADQGTNSLVITDTPAAIERVRELVAKLDSGEREIVYRIHRLENTPVATLQTQVRQFLLHLAQLKGLRTPLTDIIADPVANSVVIYGPSDEAELLTDLLIQLDSESLRERNAQVRPLERARATDTATQLTQLLAQITTGPNAPRIVANEETNSLLIIATPADMTLIDNLIKGLDADDGGLRRARVYRLKNAVSTTLLPTLRGLVGPTAEISAHTDSNSIVYTDTAANVDKVFRLIEELDTGSRMEEVVSRVVPLENTNAVAVTTPLQTIVTQVNAFRQRGNKPPAQISPQIDSNAVLIVGASDDVDQLANIVRQLDAESLSEREPEFFALEWARAQDVATELTQLFAQTRDFGLAPRIVANEWANALMVMADPRDLAMIKKLIEQLDTREGRQRIIRIFPLENAEAYLLAPRIQELFQGGTTRSSARQQRRSYGYYDSMYGSGRRSLSLTEGEVSIVEDQRLNALIVTAEPQDMEQVAEMIEALDIEAPYSETPRVYTLKNAEAEDIAKTLNDLFADTDYVQGRYWGMDREVSVSGLSGRIRVMSVPQTNQIIVLASSPRAFQVVEEMIKELDQVSVQAGRTQTIKVKHADVISLKKTLDELFKPEQNQGQGAQRFLFDYFDFGGGFGGGGSFSNLIGKVRIEADTRTSTLLVVTPELYFPDVEKLIQRLDVPTKQILLRVLIAELTRNNERDLGIQWGVDPTTMRVGSIDVNNRGFFNFDNDRGDYLNPFTDPADYINPTNITDPAQVVTLNSTQFGMVLNFLQTCQDIKIKQSPSITGADNEKALIRVGSETPFISDIDQSAGQVTSSVEYRPLGLTLEVTPHVNSSTEVSLLISVKDGAIDPTIPLLLNSAATFTDREIKTRALVQNRHTIVLGGIITEEQREVIDEVPLLNRLPVVGDKFFRNRNNVKETFEILIFITPYILNDGVDSRVITEMYRNQSKDRELMEMELEGGGWLSEMEDDLRLEHATREKAQAQRRKEQEDLEFEEIVVPPTSGDPWRIR